MFKRKRVPRRAINSNTGIGLGDYIAEHPDDYTCQKILKYKYEGEKCFASSDCYRGFCIDKKCKSLDDGSVCTSTKECKSTSYCSSDSICKELIDEDEPCTKERTCKVGLFCGNGKCVKAFSLDNGVETIEKYACKGFRVGTQLVNGVTKTLCVTEKAINKACNSNNYCSLNQDFGGVYQNKTIYYNCVASSKGVYTCPLEETTTEFENYVKVYKEVLDDLSEEEKSKIQNPLILDSRKVNEAFSKYWYYPQIHDGDDCIEDYFMRLTLNASYLNPLMILIFLNIILY